MTAHLQPGTADGIELTLESAVAIVTLARPGTRNALDGPARARLRTVLSAVADEPAIHALVLTGAAGAFCSGSDLDALVAGDSRTVLLADYLPIIRSLRIVPMPVIAAVEGVAAGAGAGLLLACDLVVAARTARIDVSFVRLGLVPDASVTWHLVRALGRYRALQLIWTGGSVSAEDAAAWGIVTTLTESGQALDAAVSQARQLATGPRPAIAAAKRLVEGALTADLWTSMADEADVQGRMRVTPEHRAALAAVMAGRRSRREGDG